MRKKAQNNYVNVLMRLFAVLLSAIAAAAASGLYYSASRTVTVSLISIFLSAASISSNVMMAVIVDLFPTYLR